MLVIVFYSALFLHPGYMFSPFEDSVAQNFYYENYARASINQTSKMPLWDTTLFSGMPFAGRSNNPFYYCLPALGVILLFVWKLEKDYKESHKTETKEDDSDGK